jgi:hypothetical protein
MVPFAITVGRDWKEERMESNKSFVEIRREVSANSFAPKSLTFQDWTAIAWGITPFPKGQLVR